MPARFLDLSRDDLFIGENGPVFGCEDFVRQTIQRITRDGFVFLTAKNKPDRRVFVGARPVFARVVEIRVHLAGISVREPAALEIDHDETAELAMKEKQIDAIPFIADAETALSANKSEIAAELQEKPFQMQDERFFDFALRVFVFESEKLQNVRVFDLLLSRDRIFRLGVAAFAQHFGFVS